MKSDSARFEGDCEPRYDCRVLYSLRFVLVAPTQKVSELLDRALLHGEPGHFPDKANHENALLLFSEQGPEWKMSNDRVIQNLRKDIYMSNRQSMSLGLLPLRQGEYRKRTQDRSMVILLASEGSRIVAQQISREGSECTFIVRTCELKACNMLETQEVSSQDLVDADAVVLRYHLRSGPTPNSAELICDLLSGTACNYWDVISPELSIVYAIELQVRAWFVLHALELQEVWRSARKAEEAFLDAHALSCIALYSIVGGGASSTSEIAAGPIFSISHAQELAILLPGVWQNDRANQFNPGSVCIEEFAWMLGRICQRAAPEADIFRRFVDLGSGQGHAVLAAHALFPFRCCTGCEIIPEYVEVSRLHVKICSQNGLILSKAPHDLDNLFIVGDFLQDFDWSDASIVFCNAFLWPSELLSSIGRISLRLRRGAVVIVMGLNQLFDAEPEVLAGFDVRGEACSLGCFAGSPSGVRVYQRI